MHLLGKRHILFKQLEQSAVEGLAMLSVGVRPYLISLRLARLSQAN